VLACILTGKPDKNSFDAFPCLRSTVGSRRRARRPYLARPACAGATLHAEPAEPAAVRGELVPDAGRREKVMPDIRNIAVVVLAALTLILGLAAWHYRALAKRSQAEKGADGVNPREARRVDAERDRVARLNTFELTARVWHAQAQKDREWSAGYAEKVMLHLKLRIFPGSVRRFASATGRPCAQIRRKTPTEYAATRFWGCLQARGDIVLSLMFILHGRR